MDTGTFAQQPLFQLDPSMDEKQSLGENERDTEACCQGEWSRILELNWCSATFLAHHRMWSVLDRIILIFEQM